MDRTRQAIRALPRLQPRDVDWATPVRQESGSSQTFIGGWLSALRAARNRRWAVAAAVVVVFVFAVNLALQRTGRSSGLVVSAYALDMEMYLDGISHDPSQLEKFAALYQSRPVRLEQAQAHVSFELSAPAQLPGGFSFAEAYLLKSGCCHAVRLRYWRPGGVVDVFQQPLGHPVSFGSKPKFASAALPQCQCARSDAHQAYYWEAAGKGLVVVSDLPEGEVPALVAALMPRVKKDVH